MSIILVTPSEMAHHIAKQVQAKRLYLNLSQQTLSDRSGVSYSVLKKFEHTGQISLGSLLKLALALGCLDSFKDLFAIPQHFESLDELLNEKTRKRGRK